MKRKLITSLLALTLVLSHGATGSPAEHFTDTAITASAAYESEKLQDYAKQVLAIINRERAANGLSAVRMNDKLCDAANVRAKEIQKVFSHTRPNGKTCFTALNEAGVSYTYAAENIAYGQKTPEAVMKSFMNSSGHRANILSRNAQYVGIGISYKNGTYYWTQFFAKGNLAASESTAPSKGNTSGNTTAKAPAAANKLCTPFGCINLSSLCKACPSCQVNASRAVCSLLKGCNK